MVERPNFFYNTANARGNSTQLNLFLFGSDRDDGIGFFVV